MKPHAVGILTRNRWELTYATLHSLYHSSQSRSSYDLFVIDNASSDQNREHLREWVNNGLLPIKNVIFFDSEVKIPEAWNLFFALTHGYTYRTKIDNDLILLGTPSVSDMPVPLPTMSTTMNRPLPGDSGANPGKIPVASFVTGATGGQSRRRRDRITQTNFLDMMQDFHHRTQAQLVSLLPIKPGSIFHREHDKQVRSLYNNNPYIVGNCLMITHHCFEKVGYFDESLPRDIEVDYSQRAMKQGMSVGYHDKYWVFHIGHNKSTEGDSVADDKRQLSQSIAKQRGIVSQPMTSKWAGLSKKLRYHANKNKIINLK